MAFVWRDYLHLARVLSKGGLGCPDEASFRSCVSRAYYAAYRHARDYAETKENFNVTKLGGDHGALIVHFSSRNQQISDDLKDLLNWRNKCDYDSSVGDLRKMTATSLNHAGFIINYLK